MSKNVKIKIDKSSMEKLTKQITESFKNGAAFEAECPLCGKPFVAAVGDVKCPHCQQMIHFSL